MVVQQLSEIERLRIGERQILKRGSEFSYNIDKKE